VAAPGIVKELVKHRVGPRCTIDKCGTGTLRW